MEKWEQEIMKQVNGAMPETIEDRVNLTLKGLKRERSRLLKQRYGILTAAILLITIGMSSLSPSFAESLKSLPLLKSVFELVGGVDVKRGSELQLTTELGQKVNINDQEITFTESLYDGSKINLGWTVPSNDRDPWAFTEDIMFTIDGKRIEDYGGNISYEKLDNGMYAGTISIDVRGDEHSLPESFVLGLMSTDETITYANIPIVQEGEYQTYTIGQTKTWDDNEVFQVDYDAVTLYPTTTEISFSLSKSTTLFWDFHVYDDQGRVLQPISSGGGGYKDKNHFKAYFEPFEMIPNKIFIKPYMLNPSSKISGEWKGEPLTIDQGKAGSLTILDQKIENNKLTLTYEAEGYRIFEQLDRIWLEDSKGVQYHENNIATRIKGTNKYQLTFSNVSDIDSIYICTYKFNTKYLEGLEVSIDLQQ